MSNQNLATKIKALRNQKGITQEDLALESGLSLRTVQRIENAQSKAYTDSIQKLANALKVHPESLTNWQLKEDYPSLRLMILSAFSFLLFPVLGIVIPMILWIIKKDQIQYANKIGKRVLIFQTLWNLLLFGGLVTNWMLMNNQFLLAGDIQPNFFQPYREFTVMFIVLMFIINLIFLLINLYRLKKLKV